MKKAFTLAEIMIVLTVIAIITAILLPSARNAMPNEDLMKFKKAHNTLYSAIQELVNSDKYYLDGDLGIKPNGDLIDGTHEGDLLYFCNTLSDVLNAKNTTCSSIDTNVSNADQKLIDEHNLESLEWYFDLACRTAASRNVGAEIILDNNVIFYQSGPTYPFSQFYPYKPDGRVYATKVGGFYSMYKMFCIDIDGTPSGVSKENCINTCPFGYGIRLDGKIKNGKQANEWLAKSIQEKD